MNIVQEGLKNCFCWDTLVAIGFPNMVITLKALPGPKLVKTAQLYLRFTNSENNIMTLNQFVA